MSWIPDRYQRALETVGLALVAACGVWATSHTVHSPTAGDWLGLVGGYTSAASYVVLTLLLLLVAERVLVPEVDFFKEIGEGNVAVAIFAGLLLLSFAIAGTASAQERSESVVREGEGVWARTRCISPGAQMPIIGFALPQRTYRAAQAAPDTARRYVGTVERPPGSNEGETISRFLRAVGLGEGYPYCAAFCSYVYEQTPQAEGPATPQGSPIRTAGATDFADARRVIDPTAVRRGRKAAPPGAVVVWKRRGTWRGHAGIVVEEWAGRCGKTVEANTSPGA